MRIWKISTQGKWRLLYKIRTANRRSLVQPGRDDAAISGRQEGIYSSEMNLVSRVLLQLQFVCVSYLGSRLYLSNFLKAGLIADSMTFLTSALRVSTSFWLKFDLLSISLKGLKRTDSSTFPFKWLWICPGTAWKEFCYLCHCQVDYASYTCLAYSGLNFRICLALLLFSFCWRFLLIMYLHRN